MQKTKKVHQYYVYIMTNPNKTVLYTGVTNNILRRQQEHENSALLENRNTFAGKYQTNHIVYYEVHQYILNAIDREKQIKKLTRAKKIELIESINPDWEFWFEEYKEYGK